MPEQTKTLIKQYYDAFNTQDMNSFLALLDDNVVHHINQGQLEIGRETFAKFMQRMAKSYQEKITSLVVMVNEDGSRAAAEFIVEGKYLVSDHGLPEAKGQTYSLPCGAFFSIRNNKITRVSNYYNLQDWLDQVS